MPKVNGIEAINYFKKEYPTLPIIVITGFPDTDRAVELLSKELKDYIVKPVEKERLLGAVRKGKDPGGPRGPCLKEKHIKLFTAGHYPS